MKSTFTHAQLICTCGYDLRQSPASTSPTPWERLAHYSAEVLFNQEDIEECANLYRFLDTRLAEHGVMKRPQLLDYLSRTYGADSAKAILALAPQRTDKYTHPAIGSMSKHEFRAPQICAFLAAIDLNFAQSNRLLLGFIASNVAAPMASSSPRNAVRPRVPKSILEARSYVAETERSVGKGLTRSYLYKRYKTLFWYLTIFDRKWFEERYPSGGKGATQHLPSVELDRVSIMEAIHKAPRNSIRIWKNLSQQAYFRASLRDLEWLEERKAETTRASKNDRSEKKRRFLDACIDDLNQAIGQLRVFKGHAIRISPAQLAPYTKLNEDQLRHLLANNPTMRAQLIGSAGGSVDEESRNESVFASK